MAHDRHTALLSIGIVAATVGIHPQTLREYERQGLVEPQRTPGGTRRYGAAELDRLRRIQALTAEGMSLRGVRYVLDLEDRLRCAEARVQELEADRGTDAPTAPPTNEARHTTLVTRSMSVELVHVPRSPRSPRWRNAD
ncbi:MAG: MerR family transcriptional regulator [Thermoleophilia bacterium]|nr:MerR family transcriptional regulator [Thermoleophilia bacterium]